MSEPEKVPERRHGGTAGLCFHEHLCPECEHQTGRPCMDIFVHPDCGRVACAMPGEDR